MVKPYWWESDFNGDGLPFDFGNTIATATNPFTDDFLFQNVNSGVGAIWLINGGGASVNPGGQIAVGGGGPWDILGSASFTTDQHPDLIEQHDTNGSVRIEFLDGPTGATLTGSALILNSLGTAVLAPGTNWQLAGTGAFDSFASFGGTGNPGASPGQGPALFGTTDLLFQNTVTGAVGEWYLMLPNGNGAVTTQPDPLGGIHHVGLNPGPTWHVVGAADTTFQFAPVGTPSFFGDTGPVASGQAIVGGGIQYDLYFQNDNGSVGVWHIAGQAANNDPVVTAAGVVDGNPGPTWDLISVQGDFDGNGVNDLLFQNDNGAEAIWLMGTNFVPGTGTPFVLPGGQQFLTNPGAVWEVKGVGDYDGDGLVDDIRLQNSVTGAIEDQLLGQPPAAGQVGAPGAVTFPNPFVATNVIDGNPGTTWHLLFDDFLLST
jgi:hypothetical protein